MLKQKMSGMSASTLRLLLSISTILIITIGAVLFWFAFGQLKKSAIEVQDINAKAASSSENLASLRTMETKLAANAESVQRAKDIVAESKFYQYQDTIIDDLESYAAKSQLAIDSYNFAESTAAGGGTTAPAPASASAPSATTVPGAAGVAPATPAGLKSSTVSVSLSEGARFESLMTFIGFVERNLTKMQLSGVSLSKDEKSGTINSGELTIEVYVR